MEEKFKMTYGVMTKSEVRAGLNHSKKFMDKHCRSTWRIKKFIRDAIKANFPMKEEGFEEFLRYYGK
jgi:hypothetical protein